MKIINVWKSNMHALILRVYRKTYSNDDECERSLYELWVNNITSIHLKQVIKNRSTHCRDRTGRFSCCKLAINLFLGLFPFIRIMRDYNLKHDLVKDLVAGLTVFVMGIPQGMANGILSSYGAVYGLYTSTFPTFIYFFLGTSRHLALGTKVLIINSIWNTIRLVWELSIPECPYIHRIRYKYKWCRVE